MHSSASERSISDADIGPAPPAAAAAPAPAAPAAEPRTPSDRAPPVPRRENPLSDSAGSPRAQRPSPPGARGGNDPTTPIAAGSFDGSEAGSPRSDDLYIRRGHRIGQGAFGSVYMGINMKDSQLVAIKQIKLADANDSIVRAIQREIDVMTRLPPHPNCVRYLGRKTTARHISIIMEYVSGGSVASLYQAVGGFHEATVRRYASMALKGLAHLHLHGIVHQDIKGANVLADAQGVAKIADFGCSKDLHMLTGSLKTAGTPLWMAPEVCQGASATTMSDVWSFGCFVLEMAKEDHLPWSGLTGGLFAVMYAIGNARQPPPLPDALTPQAKDFLRRCLAIDPRERATADELLHHPWMSAEFADSFDGWKDSLGAGPSATQTLVSDLSGCSLKDLGSDSDDDDDDPRLGPPRAAALGGPAVAAPEDPGTNPWYGSDPSGRLLHIEAPMSPLSGSGGTPARPADGSSGDIPAFTPTTKPVVYRANGGAEAAVDEPGMLATYSEVTPHDCTPSPSTAGRRKLGQRRSLFQKLFGS